jgi:quinol monooxygenase YgiN
MSNLRRLAALCLLPCSALFIAPGISGAQQRGPTAEHPTYTAQRQESTVITHALFIRLEAKPGKEKELAQFLQTGLDLARQEGTTPVWFALQLGTSTFGVFDAFTDEAGRQAHLNGPIAQALGANAPNLLARAPSIERIDVLGTKLP